MEILLIGGTGFIGQAVSRYFKSSAVPVFVLTRNPKEENHRFWDPQNKEVEGESLKNITHIINLNGAGIAEKRWTPSRKRELYSSRIEATAYLFELTETHCPMLQHYIGVSGINAFGFSEGKTFQEKDPFGSDYLSTLVRDWESAHWRFQIRVKTTVVRLGMVLDPRGGAYTKMAVPTRLRLGTVVGSGKQLVPWISLEDVVGLLYHLCVAKKDFFPIIHGVCAHSTMAEISHFIAHEEGKKIWLPNLPSFLVHLLFGSMGQLLTRSLNVGNGSLIATGYTIKNTTLNAITDAKKN